MRTLLGDGNFKQDHLAMKKDTDDVALSDGYGYMVKRRPFEKYITEAPPVAKQVRPRLVTECHSRSHSSSEKHMS